MAQIESGDLKDYKNFIDFLKTNKQDFSTRVGNFSALIEFEGEKYRFSNSNRSFAIFGSVQNIKRELKPHLDFFKTDKKGLQYYFKKNDFIEEKGEFYNLDIKRAYPTTLYNTGFLSSTTIEKIEKLKKQDKLAVCGMLAYNPDIFIFEAGKVISHKKLNQTENFIDFSSCFFYCVKKIQDLMLEIINETDGDYYFTWVDGIFFRKDDKLKNKIVDIIRKHNYECTFQTCKDLKTEINEHTLFVEYLKGDEIEPTKLSFPSQYAISKRKYEIFHKIFEEQNSEIFVEEFSKHFVLDEKGNVIF